MWKKFLPDASIVLVVNSIPAKTRLEYFFVSLPPIWRSETSAASQTADQVSTELLL